MSTPQRTLIWWVPFCAGGLCDRLIGMISAYCIAKELNRHFLIKWDQNDVSSVLKINPEHNYYTYKVPFTEVLKTNIEYMSYFEKKKIEEKWKQDHILIWSNLNLFIHFCKSRSHIAYKEKFLQGIGESFTKFLLPVPDVEENIPLGLDDAVGIHIRTHDNQIDIKNTENRKKQFPYIKDILSRCKKHIEEHKQGKTIFIASDCVLAASLVAIEFGPEYKIISSNGPIVHSGQKTVDRDGMIRVMVDLLALSRCKLLYIGWHTNYSRFGALLNPKREFFTFEHPKSPKDVVSCNFDNLMNYHSQGGRW